MFSGAAWFLANANANPELWLFRLASIVFGVAIIPGILQRFRRAGSHEQAIYATTGQRVLIQMRPASRPITIEPENLGKVEVRLSDDGRYTVLFNDDLHRRRWFARLMFVGVSDGLAAEAAIRQAA